MTCIHRRQSWADTIDLNDATPVNPEVTMEARRALQRLIMASPAFSSTRIVTRDIKNDNVVITSVKEEEEEEIEDDSWYTYMASWIPTLW